MTAVETATRSGARYGGWALVLAIVVVLWPLLTGIGVIGSLSQSTPDWLRIIVVSGFVVGLALVPLSFIVSLIFGTLAIRRNRRLGRVCGVVALVILALVVVSVVVLGALGFLGSGFLGTGIGA